MTAMPDGDTSVTEATDSATPVNERHAEIEAVEYNAAVGSYDPFEEHHTVAAAMCNRFTQPIAHWSKTVHAKWFKTLTKAEAVNLLDESRRNAEIGVGNKGYDESTGSRVHSLNPFLEQFVLEYDGTGEDQQARRGDIGVAKVVAAMIKLTKDSMTESSTLDYFTRPQCNRWNRMSSIILTPLISSRMSMTLRIRHSTLADCARRSLKW